MVGGVKEKKLERQKQKHTHITYHYLLAAKLYPKITYSGALWYDPYPDFAFVLYCASTAYSKSVPHRPPLVHFFLQSEQSGGLVEEVRFPFGRRYVDS